MTEKQIRREFFLPEDDTEYLNSLGLCWETIRDGNDNWLLVHELAIPEGYNVRTATAAVQIPASYPTAGLDMVFFDPPLKRLDGKPINATEHIQKIRGVDYQRWSRHYTSTNPWRPGIDNISTHFALIEEWLLREFRKG